MEEGEGQPTPGGAPPTEPATGSDERKFTQADLDKFAGDARDKGRKAAEKALLEALGATDLETAKALLAKAQEAEEANKTELQKATEERDRLAAEAQQAKAEALQVRLDASLERALVEGGLRPERVAAAMRLADRSGLSVEGDQVSGLAEAVAGLKVQSPEWFGTPTAPDASGNAPPVGPQKLSTDELRSRLKEQYQVRLR